MKSLLITHQAKFGVYGEVDSLKPSKSESPLFTRVNKVVVFHIDLQWVINVLLWGQMEAIKAKYSEVLKDILMTFRWNFDVTLLPLRCQMEAALRLLWGYLEARLRLRHSWSKEIVKFDPSQIIGQVGTNWSDWIRCDQIGSHWIRLDHIGSNWIRLDQISSDLIQLDLCL